MQLQNLRDVALINNLKDLNLTIKCLLKSNVNEKSETKCFSVPYENWKKTLLDCSSAQIHGISFIEDDGGSHLVDIDPQTDLQSFKEATRDKKFPTQTYMNFSISLNGGNILIQNLRHIPEAFESDLTEIGESQRKVVENYIKQAHKCFRSGKYYAPMSPLIQSSGYGKSRICDEILQKHPGITAVFRGTISTTNEFSYPHEQSWVSKMMEFIYENTVDELPSGSSMLQEDASRYSSGRMLMALETLIVAYYKWFEYLRNNGNTRNAAIKIIGQHFRSESKVWGHNPSELVFVERKVAFGTLVNNITFLLRHQQSASSSLERIGISNDLVKELMPQSRTHFPFIFFFDEAAVFDDGYECSKSRLSGLHVLRRGLHLLTSHTYMYLLAVGTNSDAIDFSPALRTNSIRNPLRANLLPAFWLTRNSGIFSNKLKLHEIEVKPSFLLNRNVMKLFFAMGRPLWSSYLIEDVLSRAETKISNGNPTSNDTLISYLLCRAELSVIPSSILSRNLVKSHMAVVYFVSTDSRTMKIGYPSEPALALASRNRLKDVNFRESAFEALFEFLQMRSIDKGRISETIMEHFILFAIDDVVKNPEYLAEFENEKYILSENSGTGNINIDKVFACSSFILDIKWSEDTGSVPPENMPPTQEEVSHESYHVVSVVYFLKSLLTEKVFLSSLNYLPEFEPLMNGYTNTSHFVNFEHDSKEILAKYFKMTPKSFTVDRNLLKMGLIRGCGFVLTPGTYGLDFIIPVLLDTKDDSRRPNYGFIGIQVKTSAGSFYSEAAKTSGSILIEKCLKRPECIQGNHHSGCMSDLEYEEIVSNQLNFILCIDRDGITNRSKGDFYSVRPALIPVIQVSSTQKRSRLEKPIDVRSDNDDEKGEVESLSNYEDALGAFGPEMDVVDDDEEIEKEKEEISEVTSKLADFSGIGKEIAKKESEKLLRIKYAEGIAPKIWSGFESKTTTYFDYPVYKQLKESQKPDLLIKSVINDTLSIQNLFWDRGDGKSHRLTCLICNDLNMFTHLASPKTVDVCKQIVVYVNSLFDDVDSLNLPAVIDSALHLEFSKFHQFNPELRALRGEDPFPDGDSFESMSHYTDSKLDESIRRSINRNKD